MYSRSYSVVVDATPPVEEGAFSNRTPTVLVLWVGHRGGPWTLDSLERSGYRTVPAHPDLEGGAPLRREVLRYPSATADPEGFLRVVSEWCRTRGIDAVLPLDEDIVRLLAERAPDLGGAVVAGPTGPQYAALCDKAVLADTARAAGVDHPVTVEVGFDGPSGELPAAPCIVKPRISGSHGAQERPTLARTARERDEAVRTFLDAGIPALLQEQLEGPRWVGHCVRAADRFDFVGYRVERDYPRSAGPASIMHTAQVPPEVVSATRRLLDHVGYLGPCSLSFIQVGTRFLVHDVNLRLGATVAASIRSGFDIPRRSVDAVLGRPDPPLPPVRGVRYVRFDGEVKELVRGLRRRPGADNPLWLGRAIVAGLVSRRTVLDPPPLAPSWAAPRVLRRANRLRP
jgi:hypothetical protein